ncbi:solute:sodium symporter family transporter [Vibrio mediterranei]|uniref:solute:sodium symporter family transporter n=1 Tax=Vibrio mediterranei TaxID=689 RepID=UPI002284E2D1|nr:solute:sodium symporter family transporter [Vibrio mediterranei]MCY9855088.1 solute:sodium symporter family transporter [Vibrio mediterranei]
MYTLLSFVFFTALVALISYLKTKKENLTEITGYFLAGRSLPWFVIAGSLFLTNISAEQLTGLNANAFRNGANVMAWEATSALTLIALAFIFLPRYLKSGISTIPHFLEQRFGRRMRIVSSFIFIYAIVIGFLPFVLYAGAITLGQLFNVNELFGLTQQQSVWLMVISLGAIGGIYAIFGGLKAVAVSDTINGVAVLICGLLVPLLGLHYLGDGSVFDGLHILVTEAPERLNAPGLSENANIPWHGVISGVIIINLFYWCTNQAIVQRTLAAKNLAESQKGVLAAGLLKIVGVLMLVLPGIIAWHLHQRGVLNIPFKVVDGHVTDVLNADISYPTLVRYVLPSWLTGFFGAAMFGAILSSFNSGINSLSTLISLDIYKPLINPKASDIQTVKVGKVFGIATTIICIVAAPYISQADSLYTLMRTIMAVINIPIFAVVLLGIVSKRAPALAGYIGLVFGMIFFYITHFVLKDDLGIVKLHWLNLVGLNLVLMMMVMLTIRFFKPLEVPFKQVETKEVEVTPWKYGKHAAWALALLFCLTYSLLSPIGITSVAGSVSTAVITSVVVIVVLYFLSKGIRALMVAANSKESKKGYDYV